MPKCIELLPCDWLISNLCYQAIEQVYLILWPVSVCIYIQQFIILLFGYTNAASHLSVQGQYLVSLASLTALEL